MAEMKFAVAFEAIDRLTATLTKVQKGFRGVDEQVKKASEHLKATGEALVKVGAVIGGIGAATGFAIKSTVDAAIADQAAWAHVGEAVHDGIETQRHLTEAMETADRIAVKSVISTENLAEAYYLARSNAQTHEQAIRTMTAATNYVTATTHDAVEANAQMADSTRLLTGLSNTYHIEVDRLSDSLVTLQQDFGFRGPQEVTDALKQAAPAAHAAHIAFGELATASAILSTNMITGTQNGAQLNQLIEKFVTGGSKGLLRPFIRTDEHGAFLFQKSLEALYAGTAKMDPTKRLAFLAEAGLRDRSGKAAAILLDSLNKWGGVHADFENNVGRAARTAATRLTGTDEKLAALINRFDVLKKDVGETLRPTFDAVLDRLTVLVGKMIKFVETHKALVAQMMKWGAIASVIFTVAGALTALMGAVLIVDAFFSTFGIGLAAAAPWLLAAAALVVAAYEIYEHWGAIKTFLLNLWASLKAGFANFWDMSPVINAWNAIKTFFKSILPAMRDVGLSLLKELGKGILDGIAYLASPLSTAAKFILGHFKGHSPPPLGPLHELDRVRIIETISETIHPHLLRGKLAQAAGGMLAGGSPFIAHDYIQGKHLQEVTASHIALMTHDMHVLPESLATAMAALPAFSQPMAMMPMPALPVLRAQAPPFSSPERVPTLAEAKASAPSGKGTLTVPVTVHYNITTGALTPMDFDKHAHHIARVVKDVISREERLSFEH